MNAWAHFLTGCALGVLLKARRRKEVLFVGLCACAPDVDVVASLFSSTTVHGTWTHTIIGVLVGTILGVAIAFGSGVGADRLATIALWIGCALLSHLVLDMFTFNPDCTHIPTHLYLWPVSRQSFELNCLFPGTTLEMRVAIEILYNAAIAAVCVLIERRTRIFRGA